MGIQRAFHKVQILVGELFLHPETVTVSSTGVAFKNHSKSLGVFKITNITLSDRPVWQSTVRDDRYLLYNGNNFHISKSSISNISR